MQGRWLKLAPLLLPPFHNTFLLLFSVGENYMAFPLSLPHPHTLPCLSFVFFFNPPSSFCTHYSLTVSIATLFFYLTHMAALLTLILRSQYQGAIHSLAWGGDRNVCVFLLWGERGRLEKWCEVQ